MIAGRKYFLQTVPLNQVFINLLSNAVKYTPAGGTITFRIMQKTAFHHGYGDYVVIHHQGPQSVQFLYLDWTDIEDEAKEAGVSAFCAKPLFMSDLKSALLVANNLVEKDEQAAAWTLADAYLLPMRLPSWQ